jgi:phosphohistidine phosphatase
VNPRGDGQDGLTLWLLRHAKAEREPPPGGDDHDRPLAPRGTRDAAALGRVLPSLGHPPPEVVLTSTARRTLQTAEAATARIGATLDRRRRLYYGSEEDVLDEVSTVGEGVASVMVVGHNPATHLLALALLDEEDASGRGALSSFPTCALAVFGVPAARWREVAARTATLAGFYRPPY